jgi:hypothetical protein
MIKFHLDEHVHPGVANGLRHRQIDVTTTPDAGLLGADDTAHIAFALDQGRVIVTHDDDFLMLHNQGIPHAGIAYCHQHRRSIGHIVRVLTALWSRAIPDEMANRVEFL